MLSSRKLTVIEECMQADDETTGKELTVKRQELNCPYGRYTVVDESLDGHIMVLLIARQAKAFAVGSATCRGLFF